MLQFDFRLASHASGTMLKPTSDVLDCSKVVAWDGGKIAFFSNRSGNYEVWVCNGDGSNAVQLTSYGGVGNGPRWSPDGRTIAFTEADGRNQSIYLIGANGGIPWRLTSGPDIEDKHPSWSQNGQTIYFDSWRRSGSNQIWKVTAAGGKAVQVTPNGVNRDLPQESPDGEFLYYRGLETAGVPYCSVWRLPVGGGAETMVLDRVNFGGGYRVREQGIYFFAPADKQGHSDISLYEFSTGKTKKIVTIEGPIAFYIDVSPDGRSILYTRVDQYGSDLMLAESFR